MVRLLFFGDFRAKDTSRIKIDSRLQCLVAQTDIAVCNFEAPVLLPGGIAEKKCGPVLSQDSAAPDYLKKVGFNVILMANNHIMDYGVEGCKETLNAFDGCICIGAGAPKQAYEVKIVEKEGQKIGFLSFVQHEFGVVESSNEENSYGAAWINSYDVENIIREAKTRVDYLFIFPHAGVEHIDAPLPEWRRCYKKLIDWGADMIVASHPHCPQGWETYKGKHIYYSLGNFYFDELKGGEYWYNSLAVEIQIDEGLKTSTKNICFDEYGQLGIDDSKESQLHIEYLNNLLLNNIEYERYINKVCESQYDDIKYGLMRGMSGFTFHIRFYYALRLFLLMILGKRNELYMLNTFQNESHRWLCERYLRNRNK